MWPIQDNLQNYKLFFSRSLFLILENLNYSVLSLHFREWSKSIYYLLQVHIYNNQKEVVSPCDEVICRQWIQDNLHLLSPTQHFYQQSKDMIPSPWSNPMFTSVLREGTWGAVNMKLISNKLSHQTISTWLQAPILGCLISTLHQTNINNQFHHCSDYGTQ